jgi:hypothetical protein
MRGIASEQRAECAVTASAQEIAANTYLIAEMYCGVYARHLTSGAKLLPTWASMHGGRSQVEWRCCGTDR